MDEIGEKCCKNEVEGNSSVPSSDATVQQAAAVTSSSGKSATAYESASKDGEEDGTDSTRSEETTLPTPTAVGSSIDAAGDSDASSSSKKDKQKLRKGKWTIEEEEYTSRVIQYFSTGLLILPDGATLRSYLADKLNCDPMRITKKFTGACCLGRRAYHLRDRPRASPAEMEVARLELQHLEQRFHLRVEHEQSGLPLPPRHEILPAQPPTGGAGMPGIPSLLASLQGGTSAPIPWLSSVGLSAAMYSNAPAVATGGNVYGALNQAQVPFHGLAGNPNSQLSQLLLQATHERMQSNQTNSPAPPEPSQTLNNLVASLVLAQALKQQQQQQPVRPAPAPANIASPSQVSVPNGAYGPLSTVPAFKFPLGVSPAVPQPVAQTNEQAHVRPPMAAPIQQIEATVGADSEQKQALTKEERVKAAFEEQQKALRLAYEKSLREAQEEDRKSQPISEAQKPEPKKEIPTQPNTAKNQESTKPLTAAELLHRSYEAHLASLRESKEDKISVELTRIPSQPKAASKSSSDNGSSASGTTVSKQQQGKERDEEAGTILLGFLNSLRGSYEDAVGNKGSNGDLAAASKKKSSKRKGKKSSQYSTDKTDNVSKKAASEPKRVVAVTGSSSDSQEYLKPSSSSRIDSLSRFTSAKRKNKPASVTETSSGTSSHPTTEQSSSSLEDSDSKSDKTDQNSSSSDEDDNDETSKPERSSKRERSKGPPRKRLKGFHNSNEFTRANLLEHSKRMDIETDGPDSASEV